MVYMCSLDRAARARSAHSAAWRYCPSRSASRKEIYASVIPSGARWSLPVAASRAFSRSVTCAWSASTSVDRLSGGGRRTIISALAASMKRTCAPIARVDGHLEIGQRQDRDVARAHECHGRALDRDVVLRWVMTDESQSHPEPHMRHLLKDFSIQRLDQRRTHSGGPGVLHSLDGPVGGRDNNPADPGGNVFTDRLYFEPIQTQWEVVRMPLERTGRNVADGMGCYLGLHLVGEHLLEAAR